MFLCLLNIAVVVVEERINDEKLMYMVCVYNGNFLGFFCMMSVGTIKRNRRDSIWKHSFEQKIYIQKRILRHFYDIDVPLPFILCLIIYLQKGIENVEKNIDTDVRGKSFTFVYHLLLDVCLLFFNTIK